MSAPHSHIVLEVAVFDPVELHRLANEQRAKDGIEPLGAADHAGAIVELLQPVIEGQPRVNVDCGFEMVNWRNA